MENTDALLHPISGPHPGGDDISYSDEIDAIREARRADDARLAQGDWASDIKTSQWPRVRDLCHDVLTRRSKDLQVAAWYTEALTRLDGFSGLAKGLAVINGLLTDFWEFCYPPLNDDDFDERAGKLEWLDREVSQAVLSIPLTSSATGFSWLKWQESRAVDNLGLKDSAARDAAIADGKIPGEVFDNAATASGRAFYERLYEELAQAQFEFRALSQHIDDRFGTNGPSMSDVRDAIARCAELIERELKRSGGSSTTKKQEPEPVAAPDEPIPTKGARAMTSSFSGAIQTREDAIRCLREVSRYFIQAEPHSPVGPLADRAASWAEMSLDQWLASVVKDDSTLNQLRELLGLPR